MSKLEKKLFTEGGLGKIGLVILPNGPGKYDLDISQVNFWDVEEKDKKNKTIFGVELGSFIIFDITYIKDLIMYFDKLEVEKVGEKTYFNVLNQKLSNESNAIIWSKSDVGIGDGWHEINRKAFTKISD